MKTLSKTLSSIFLMWICALNLNAQVVSLQNSAIEKKSARTIRPIDIMSNPQTLVKMWTDEPIPLSFYTPKEKEVQKLLNEKTADNIVTYSPLGKEKEWTKVDVGEITPYTWKWVDFELPKPDSTLTKIALRRPHWWLREIGADSVGKKVYLNMPELGSQGWAMVKAIRVNQLDTRFWDENRKGDYVSRPITGKFEHESNDVYYLYFGDNPNPLGVTGSHPIWSINRNDWVGARDLLIGEKVKTQEGLTVLKSRTKSTEKQKVYNLEIYKDHNFLVSIDGILVHNSCGEGWIVKDLYSKLGDKNPELIKVFEEAMEKGVARATGEAGIKRLSGKGQKIGDTFYQYELKTAPHSKYGDHRLYGNLEKWINPKGVVEERVMFREYVKGAH